ncbi:helix-turn-helix domain-containing protein [Paenibacillus nicotianae]|uniref:Helix-turn-helix domain-containing protein n=1 Tax=Paenibacillus nicotianae TaxID=1526551 RepID=A0ABW4URK7_9BACL
MNIAAKIKGLMEDKGVSAYQLAKETGVSYTGITKIIKGATKSPGIESLEAIAHYFGVEVSYFTTSNEIISEEKASYGFAPKEENDIAEELERMMEQLNSDSSLSFHGEKLEMSDEQRELLRISFENSLRVAKQIAKNKFTPKKNRD